jgi:hypothetical protein
VTSRAVAQIVKVALFIQTGSTCLAYDWATESTANIAPVYVCTTIGIASPADNTFARIGINIVYTRAPIEAGVICAIIDVEAFIF